MALPLLERRRRQSRSFLRAIVATVLAVAAVAFAAFVNAVDHASLSIEAVAGDGWSAHGVSVDFELPQNSANARIAAVRLLSASQEVRDINVVCPYLELSQERIACKKARLTGHWPVIGPQSFTASIEYGRRDGSLQLAVAGIRLDKGTAGLNVSLRDSGWSLAAQAQQVPIDALYQLAGQFKLSLPPFSASGLVTLSAKAHGAGRDVRESAFEVSLSELTANNESGSIATDKLSVHLQAGLRNVAGAWQFSTELRSAAGQGYVQPIFLDFGAHAARISARGSLSAAGELSLEHFTLDHSGVAQAHGRARIDFSHEQPLRTLALTLERLEFPGTYESYLQPLLLDTNFKSMQTAGTLAGELLVKDGAPERVAVRIETLTVDDGAQTFALDGLAGRWTWSAQAGAEQGEDDEPGAERSRLSWRRGTIFGLELGAAELQFITVGRQFRLLQPTRIPLLDGAIAFDSFRVRNAGAPEVAFMVDATLEPIDVQRLCQAFGWPQFGGQLGGTISKLRMREGVLTLGTTLRAQVFDGEVTLSDVRLEQPFGQWPRFYADVALENLDLALVTRAFSFGRITGRLSGRIADLKLFNWTPIAFDARLYTPENDRSGHRISQRAVENIGSIGGGSAGVTTALSSGLLRFFDDFNYDRLGWACRLENEVCTMDGVAPAPQGGYYLVKGKWLPRIDVIGSARRVDWPRLVRQLVEATQSQGPVVGK